MTFLKEEEEKNPSQINVTSLGKTHEGRDILLAKVSKSGAFGDNPVVYINCATHAREWISTAVCTWMIRQVYQSFFIKTITNSGKSRLSHSILNIMPCKKILSTAVVFERLVND